MVAPDDNRRWARTPSLTPHQQAEAKRKFEAITDGRKLRALFARIEVAAQQEQTASAAAPDAAGSQALASLSDGRSLRRGARSQSVPALVAAPKPPGVWQTQVPPAQSNVAPAFGGPATPAVQTPNAAPSGQASLDDGRQLRDLSDGRQFRGGPAQQRAASAAPQSSQPVAPVPRPPPPQPVAPVLRPPLSQPVAPIPPPPPQTAESQGRWRLPVADPTQLVAPQSMQPITINLQPPPPAAQPPGTEISLAAMLGREMVPKPPPPPPAAEPSILRLDQALSQASAPQVPAVTEGCFVSSEKLRRAVAPERDGPRSCEPVMCPMLWSEDEIAGFVCCMGYDRAIAQRIRRKRILGADGLLRMANAQMLQEFGMTSMIQCSVLRRALKRLMEFDRKDNRVYGRKVQETIDDPVLREFLIPLEDLQVQGVIAQGGYGKVHKGVLKLRTPKGKLEANKAYKVAAKEMIGNECVRQHDFLKEGRILATLTHPNICTFHGICASTNTGDGRQYILTELMDSTLWDLIHAPHRCRWKGDLTVTVILKLFEQICSGLGYLHCRSLVHADLKSSNVLIDYSSSSQLFAKICDFGKLAVRPHPAPLPSFGTAHWSAPEALRGEAVDSSADIYSCGLMLWEALAKRVPHRNLSCAQVLGAVGWAGLLPDEDYLPEVPPGLLKIMRRCLSFEPPARPTANEVAHELRQVRRQTKKTVLAMLARFLGLSDNACWPCAHFKAWPGRSFRS